MSVTITVGKVTSPAVLKMSEGTFTSAVGDTTVTLTKAHHGCNYVAWCLITLDKGGVSTPLPYTTTSLGTITAVFQDTRGFNGRYVVFGR